jgi:hypothetical protein
MDTATAGAGQVQAAEAGDEGDDKLKEKAPEAVKEDENKDVQKKMDSRSEMLKHYEKITIDGVL